MPRNFQVGNMLATQAHNIAKACLQDARVQNFWEYEIKLPEHASKVSGWSTVRTLKVGMHTRMCLRDPKLEVEATLQELLEYAP